MPANAIAKIQSEMNQNTNNPYIQAVGGMLLQHLGTNRGAAEQILAEDKTIKGSLKEMRNVAKNKQVDGCAVLTDQEGFEVVLKYFGIEFGGQAPAAAPAHKPEPVPQNTKADFDVNLDDLL